MESTAQSSSRQTTTPRVFLITGATGAIGKAIARQLANIQDSKVVLVCRDQQKAVLAVNEITSLTGNSEVSYELADLSRYDQIRNLAKRWQGPLHVLINNAACTPRSRQETPEGIEMQFATNVLGYYWLIDEFMDDNGQAYRQSKQANRMLSSVFAEKLKPYQVAVNACHPGDVNSVLSNNLGFGGHETPDQGAETPVWLATHPVGQEYTGRYFEHLRETNCLFARDKQMANALFESCANYAKHKSE